MAERTNVITRDGKPVETRAASFRPASYNPETRTITVSLGTGAPVLRYDWNADRNYTEILSMDPAHIRLDRMNGGAPLLRDHNSWSVDAVLGRFVKGSVRVEGGELIGDVRLSKAARNADTIGDVTDGILTDTSVGYWTYSWEITRDETTGIETRTCVDWEPMEGSIVPVPADTTGGVRAADKNVPIAPVQDAPVAPTTPERSEEERTMTDQEMKALRDEGARAEAARQTEIRALPRPAGIEDADVEALARDANVTPADAGLRLLSLAAERAKKNEIRPQVDVTRDEADTLLRGITSAVEFKGGVVADLPAAAADLRGLTVLDLAKRHLESRGVSVKGRTADEILGIAMRAEAGHTMGDFTSVFANVGNKKLQAAYTASSDYSWWKDLGTRADFPNSHPRYIVSLSGLGVLPTVTEGSDYEGVTQYDAHEIITPVKKGAEFRYTLEMAKNDDLGAFLRQAAEFGKSCQVTEHTMALAAMTANMVDGYAVCSAEHSNYVSAGGAPTVARIAVIDALLRAQTDGNGTVIGSGAKVGLFPIADRTVVEQMYSDRAVFTTVSDVPTVPLSRRYVPGMSTVWFLGTGDPLAMEYGWMQGDGGPVVSQYPSYKNDAILFHARDWFGIGVVKYREFAKNAGTGA